MEVKQDFEVLGLRVSFNPEETGPSAPAADVVAAVNREAETIKRKYPALKEGQVAVLVALKLANDTISLRREYKDQIDALEARAYEALKSIESFSPSL